MRSERLSKRPRGPIIDFRKPELRKRSPGFLFFFERDATNRLMGEAAKRAVISAPLPAFLPFAGAVVPDQELDREQFHTIFVPRDRAANTL